MNENEVHEKDRAIYEKIRVKERKIQNMQEENKRIYMKESNQESGLTAGQLACVSRYVHTFFFPHYFTIKNPSMCDMI